jgi:hypothetical protein
MIVVDENLMRLIEMTKVGGTPTYLDTKTGKVFCKFMTFDHFHIQVYSSGRVMVSDTEDFTYFLYDPQEHLRRGV